MKTSHRVVDTLTILHVKGRLAAEPDARELDAFRCAIDDAAMAAVDLAVDLSHIDSIDSEGIGELARALGRVSRRGGRLALVAPSSPVTRILAVTRLDTVFHVLTSEQEAVNVLVHGFPGSQRDTRPSRAISFSSP